MYFHAEVFFSFDELAPMTNIPALQKIKRKNKSIMCCYQDDEISCNWEMHYSSSLSSSILSYVGGSSLIQIFIIDCMFCELEWLSLFQSPIKSTFLLCENHVSPIGQCLKCFHIYWSSHPLFHAAGLFVETCKSCFFAFHVAAAMKYSCSLLCYDILP